MVEAVGSCKIRNVWSFRKEIFSAMTPVSNMNWHGGSVQYLVVMVHKLGVLSPIGLFFRNQFCLTLPIQQKLYWLVLGIQSVLSFTFPCLAMPKIGCTAVSMLKSKWPDCQEMLIFYLVVFAGSEAMFADLGHFSYTAIQVLWTKALRFAFQTCANYLLSTRESLHSSGTLFY